MFLFFNRTKEVQQQVIRNEWGVLRKVTVSRQDAPPLTDEQLAEALGTGLITVKTHRRD